MVHDSWSMTHGPWGGRSKLKFCSVVQTQLDSSEWTVRGGPFRPRRPVSVAEMIWVSTFWYYFRSTSRKEYGTGSRSFNQTWRGDRISNFWIYSCKLKQIMNYDGSATAVMNTGYTKVIKTNSQKDSRIPFGHFWPFTGKFMIIILGKNNNLFQNDFYPFRNETKSWFWDISYPFA